MFRRTRNVFLVTSGVLACLLAPGLASAQTGPFGPVFVSVDDAPEGNLTLSQTGLDPSTFTKQIVPEGVGSPNFGLADLHGEYHSSVALPLGTTFDANINFIERPLGPGEEPKPEDISDTLDIAFTGHTPDAAGNNISVDFHFRSDTLDAVGPPPLPNGVNLLEQLGWMNVDDVIFAQTGIPDFHVSVRSDVPEPGTLAMFVGMSLGAGLLGVRRLRRR